MAKSESAGSDRTKRLVEIVGLVLVLAVALWIYRGSLQGFFVQDDFGWLEQSRYSSFGEYLRCFFRFNPALNYRPLSQETFFLLGQKIFGLQPFGFHLAGVLLHLLGTTVLYLLLRQFFSPFPSLVGMLFYAVHGAHGASVYWISAVSEPMALLFYLISLLLFICFDRKGRIGPYLLSVLAMVFGLMSKESIVTVPLVFALYCLLSSPKLLVWTLPHFALSGLCLVVRFMVPGFPASPYPLIFGWGAFQNLLAYLSWAAGFTGHLLVLKLKWNAEASYPVVAAVFTALLLAIFLASRERRTKGFALAWFVIALQPVLYFSEHIYAYYLAPSLAGLSLFWAAALSEIRGRKEWKRFLVALPLVVFLLWASLASVKREGRWYIERSSVAKRILEKMPEIDAQVPTGRIAFLFGFGTPEFGAMQNDAAIKAFGFPSTRFILVGLDERTPDQIETLKNNGGIRDYFCFIYSRGDFTNRTDEFRENPKAFVLMKPLDYLDRLAGSKSSHANVRLEPSAEEVTADRDALRLRVVNLDAGAVDVLYTVDGRLMPAATNCVLDDQRELTVSLDSTSLRGQYHYRAIRDSANTGMGGWIPVNTRILVR